MSRDRHGTLRGLLAAMLLASLLASGAAAAGEIAAITAQSAGQLRIVTLPGGETRAELALPGKPAAVAVDPGTGRIFAVSVETRRLHVITADGVLLRTIAIPGAPFGVAVDPVTHHPWVSDWQGRAIHEIDPETGRLLRSLETGRAPSGLAISADGAWIATADRDDDTLSLIGLADGRRRVVAVGRHPFGVTLDGGRAFAVNVLDDSVSVVDIASAQVIGRIATGAHPYALALAGGRGFVTNQQGSSVTVFDAASLAVLAEIAVGDYPEGIAATADGSRVLVANWFSDTVSVIDPASLQVVAEWPMPEGPRAFGTFIGPSP